MVSFSLFWNRDRPASQYDGENLLVILKLLINIQVLNLLDIQKISVYSLSLKQRPDHMKKKIICFIYLSFLLFSISCQNQSKVELILQKTETFIEQHPDSALVLLQQIPDAQHLKRKTYYQYYLLQIQAKDKSYKDITSDTLIYNIQKYYDNKKDIEKAALASFYCGRILQEQKKYKKALQIYLDAEKYLKQSNNINLKGLFQNSIGIIKYQQLLTDNAIGHFRQAEKHFHQAKNYRNEIVTNNLIGNCLLIQEKTDSAFNYYFKALNLADKHKFKREQAGIRESIGVAYREVKDWQRAKFFFEEAWIYSEDSLKKARLSYNMAHLYKQMQIYDSATFCLSRALKYLPPEKENYLTANIFKTWSSIEENNQNFQKALEKYKLYSKHLATILEENENSAILEIEGKYKYQLIENRNKQLMIERQRILLFSMSILLILIVLVLVVVRRSTQNERKLKEAEQKIYQMKELARNFNEKENSFRNILLRHFDILKKTALLEDSLREDEKKTGKQLLQKFNKVVYGEKKLDWNILYQTLNKGV